MIVARRREPLQVRAADVELGGRRLDRAELRELGLDHLAASLKNARIIARSHHSQLASHEGAHSTYNGPTWAIMGYF